MNVKNQALGLALLLLGSVTTQTVHAMEEENTRGKNFAKRIAHFEPIKAPTDVQELSSKNPIKAENNNTNGNKELPDFEVFPCGVLDCIEQYVCFNNKNPANHYIYKDSKGGSKSQNVTLKVTKELARKLNKKITQMTPKPSKMGFDEEKLLKLLESRPNLQILYYHDGLEGIKRKQLVKLGDTLYKFLEKNTTVHTLSMSSFHYDLDIENGLSFWKNTQNIHTLYIDSFKVKNLTRGTLFNPYRIRKYY
jgi:hypothetical protein